MIERHDEHAGRPKPWWKGDAAARAAGERIEAWAAFTHWVTLTFRATSEGMRSEALGMRRRDHALWEWFHLVAQEAADDRHVPVAWCRERQRRGVIHYHIALALPPRQEDPFAVRLWGSDPGDYDAGLHFQHLWRQVDRAAGIVAVQQFEPGRLGGTYIAKHGDWDVTLACPRRPACRRRRGCIEAAAYGRRRTT